MFGTDRNFRENNRYGGISVIILVIELDLLQDTQMFMSVNN